MAHIRLPGIALLAALALCPSAGRAATAWGTVITNLATITMQSGYPDFVAYDMGYTMTCTVLIGNPLAPCMTAGKTVTPALVGSSGTLTYRISVSNCSMTSAFNVVVNDAMPDNTRFVTGAGNFFNETGDGWSTTTPSWSTDGGTNWTSGSYPSMAQGTPLKLRWTVDVMPPHQSAFISYTVSVL